MSKITSFIKRRPIVSALIGSALVLAGAGTVSAQFGGWEGHGMRGMPFGGMMRARHLDRMCAMDTKRWQPVAQAWLKADLNLDAKQTSEFDKLVAVAHPAMEQIKSEICASFGPIAPKLTPPERLEKSAAIMRKSADAMDKAVEPAKAFYATLNEQQKARVELLLDRRNGRMGHGGGRHHRGDDRSWNNDDNDHRMHRGPMEMGQDRNAPPAQQPDKK